MCEKSMKKVRKQSTSKKKVRMESTKKVRTQIQSTKQVRIWVQDCRSTNKYEKAKTKYEKSMKKKYKKSTKIVWTPSRPRWKYEKSTRKVQKKYGKSTTKSTNASIGYPGYPEYKGYPVYRALYTGYPVYRAPLSFHYCSNFLPFGNSIISSHVVIPSIWKFNHFSHTFSSIRGFHCFARSVSLPLAESIFGGARNPLFLKLE